MSQRMLEKYGYCNDSSSGSRRKILLNIIKTTEKKILSDLMDSSEVNETDKFWLTSVFNFAPSTHGFSIGRHQYKIDDDILSRKLALQHAIREKGQSMVYVCLSQWLNHCTGLQKQILEEDLQWVIHCTSNQEEGLFQDI